MHSLEALRESKTLDEAGTRVLLRDDRLGLFTPEARAYFDAEGRFHRAWFDDIAYERGLDGTLRAAEMRKLGRHHAPRIELWPADHATTRSVIERSYALLRQFAAVSELHHDAFERALAWTPERLAGEPERFRRVYQPIPILPPDQTRALVLQPTLGCSWNRCTFCTLYANEPFRARSAAEFREHVRGAIGFVGREIQHRRGVFLAQADSLCLGQARLLRVLTIVREELGDVTRWPIGSFSNPAVAPERIEDFVELREHGLVSVTFGLESGAKAVAEPLAKQASVDDYVRVARRARAAGLGCGVVVLVGAGGRALSAEHVAQTVEAVAAMDLGPSDRVYLSPLALEPGSAFEARLAELGAPDEAELERESDELRARLRARGVRAKIALYDIQRFMY